MTKAKLIRIHVQVRGKVLTAYVNSKSNIWALVDELQTVLSEHGIEESIREIYHSEIGQLLKTHYNTNEFMKRTLSDLLVKDDSSMRIFLYEKQLKY